MRRGATPCTSSASHSASAASRRSCGGRRGIALEAIKSARRKEAESAAEMLGLADIQFFDMGDYPMRVSEEQLFRLVDVYRKIHPAFVLTHSLADPYNFDHP